MLSLKMSLMEKVSNDTHILISTMESSHLLQIQNGSAVKFKHTNSGGLSALITDQPTLSFSNVYRRQNGYVNSTLIVQVVPTGVHLLEWDPSIEVYMERAKWCPTNDVRAEKRPEILAATANRSQIALTLGGGGVILLRIAEKDAIEILLVSSALEIGGLTNGFPRHKSQFESEISTMSLSPLNPQQEYSRHLSIACWGSNVVEILDINANLRSIVRSPALPSLVRSVLLYNFGSDTKSKGLDYHAYLLAGLGDGSIATMSFRGGQLGDLKIVSLGQFPVHLTPCIADGRKAVFAAGSRATVFFVDKGKLLNSPIILKVCLADVLLATSGYRLFLYRKSLLYHL